MRAFQKLLAARRFRKKALWLPVMFVIALAAARLSGLHANFWMGVIAGAFIISLGAFFWLRRFLKDVQSLAENIQAVARGKAPLRDKKPFQNEHSEFYKINKALSQIYSQLSFQQRVINEEAGELAAVISAVNGAIVAVDKDQRILFFNSEAALLFAQRQKPGKKEMFLSHLVRDPDVLQLYNKCLREKTMVKTNLTLNAAHLQSSRDYEVTWAPLQEKDSLTRGAVGLFYDISHISKTERMHVDFISNVSHELRTPLTAVHGYVQTLLEELKAGKTDRLSHFLKIIERNVKRLVSLLNHFLELSRMDSKLDLKKEKLSTEKITQSIIKDLHIENHKLRCDFSAKQVMADRHFLKQTLYNLIDNAIRYVPKGKLIEVLWSKRPGAVALTVKDQGPGVPIEHRDRLFERFYRADPSRSSKGVSGIGLSIVKRLLEKHGGSVSLRAGDGRGSEFICIFPNE